MATSWSPVIRIRAIASIGFRWPFTGIEAIRIFIGSILQIVAQDAARGAAAVSTAKEDGETLLRHDFRPQENGYSCNAWSLTPTRRRAAAWTVDGKACRAVQRKAKPGLLCSTSII